ncbi:MAG TPA: homoserine dehydrogenase [Alphaproteobacteria bacterium]|nr:homoserine dehydrogenase [Alphaproteobacteria bacterium]
MPAAQPLTIAIAGLGTVGAGVLRLLTQNAGLIGRRAGRPLQVVAVSARDRARNRGVDLGPIAWFGDAVAMAREAPAEILVELIGGAEGAARAAVEAAMGHGRSVVTANKALLAHHGTTLARLAEAKGVALSFEAAVAGGIPVIKSIKEGLAGNRVQSVYGILNGTCNYILSAMRQSRRGFAEMLAEAQRLGYAEADPSFDIDGLDTAHKLAILAGLAFGAEINLAGVHVEGIRSMSLIDFDYADELGFRIKLLGIARRTEHGLEQRVHPAMVPAGTPIAHVDGVFNAVVTEGDFVGRTLMEGRGAGAGPTASAVVADLIDLALGDRRPTFGVPASELAPIPASPMDRHRGAYYIRLMVVDRPGVIADVAAALRDEEVSLEAVLQRGRDPGEVVPVVLTTHETEEARMRRALARIARLDTVLEPPHMIRIEAL